MRTRKRLAAAVCCAALAAWALPAGTVFADTVLTDNATGVEDGYDYELWKDSGNTTMVLTGGGTFSCEWSNINNCLFRKGKKFGATQTYQEIGNITVDFEADYQPNGNSYLCVYGWTKNPLVEYYIVESWGSWRPPGVDPMGEITVDGGVYDVYKSTRVNQPSIEGNTTFDQYWSVRREKRESGTINVAQHFAEWEKLGLQMGNLYEAALNVEGYQSSGKATILKNDLTVGGEIPDPQPETPVEPDADGYYFHSTFEEDDKDEWTSRGDAQLDFAAEAAAGEQSLAVTGRTDTWHGAARSLSTKAFVPGTAYSFSALAMQNTADTENFKLTLQYNLNGEEQYASVAEAEGKKGEWVQLANESFTIPEGATGLLLYVESDTTTDFFVDEAIGAPEGTHIDPPDTVVTPGGDEGASGDVNGDGSVAISDAVLLQKYLLGTETEIDTEAADLDASGTITAKDLTCLKRLLAELPPDEENPPQNEDPLPERVEGEFYNLADISWIDPDKPMAALCFDDGPVNGGDTSSAGRIQTAIAENGFHATFFYWGNRISSENESEILRAQDLGFEIANHTWTHTDLTGMSSDAIQEEIGHCAQELKRITGLQDFLLRPPYLGVNDTVKAAAGVPLITDKIDSQDWNGASTEQIVNTITTAMDTGELDNAVVLMHETYDTTAAAIEQLAPYMKEKGWQIVTVSEMFKANGKTLYNGQVYTTAN